MLLSYVSYNTLNYAQTMTEWMGGDVIGSATVRESPYQLKYVSRGPRENEGRAGTASCSYAVRFYTWGV